MNFESLRLVEAINYTNSLNKELDRKIISRSLPFSLLMTIDSHLLFPYL